MNNKNDTQYTRNINPKLGLLGFLGLSGIFGFWTYKNYNETFPFMFFVFFAFFSFYFEGKMSGTLIDERYLHNKTQAELKAYKIGFTIIYFMLLVSQKSFFVKNSNILVPFLLITSSLAVSLVMFLSTYLLYKYDNADKIED